MRSLYETFQQISLGLFVNGSYGLMHGDINIQNALIVLVTIQSMYIFNRLKEDATNGR